MASQFPKLPGYVVDHDPTIVNHKKVSHVKLDKIRNAQNVDVPLYAVPKPPLNQTLPDKSPESMSYSHCQYPAHLGTDTQELFEPTFVKLDKQVSQTSSLFSRNRRALPSSLRDLNVVAEILVTPKSDPKADGY